MATISGTFNFNDEEATQCAETLKNAMDGFGTNEEDIVRVLVEHNNDQRQEIAKTYESAYGKVLMEDLKSELSGDLEDVIIALMMPPREYDAYMIHEAICGAGTDENTLIGILCTRNNEQIEKIKEIYKEKYESDMTEDIKDDTSGYFQRLMRSLCLGGRQESDPDDDAVETDAENLVQAGVASWGTDESEFNKVLCLRSYDHLKKVIKRYEEKRDGTSLDEDIDSEMSSDVQEAFHAIIKVTRDKEGYFAERLYKAMKGLGTDDKELIRCICSQAEDSLKWIMVRYQELYETDLFDAVKDECGGYYKSVLLSLLRGSFVSKDE